ncbi:hypothetical protein VTI74DRAFT_11062 [Chaetomium olivicolor]
MQLTARDDQSSVSTSEYAPSTQANAEVVDFPPPPRGKEGGKYFECPYCFTLCSTRVLNPKAWKAHLIHDLKPYVCTYEGCRNPNQVYDVREDWIQHENTNHRAVWCCPEHPNLYFPTVNAYQAHLAEAHGTQPDDEHSPSIIRAGGYGFEVSDRCCPVCNYFVESANDLHKHIALHLERIALFSLPHVGGDDEHGNDGGSQSVNMPDDSARDDESGRLSAGDMEDDDGPYYDEGHDQGAQSAADIARGKWRTVLDTICLIRLGFDRKKRLRTAWSFQSPLRAMHDDAMDLASQGRLREAEELYAEILEVRVRAFGRQHPRTLTSMVELATLYEQEGLKRRADELLAEVARTRLLLAPRTFVGAANLALPYRNQGLPQDAEELERRLMTAEEQDRQQKQQPDNTHPHGATAPGQAISLSDCQAQLFEAVKTGNYAAVELLLSIDGVNPDAPDSNDRTPLSWAAGFGNAALVQLFLATPGVDADFPDCRGQTPLSWAADCGHTEVVALLLDSGRVSPDSKDASGWTPLSWAASKGYEQVVRLLLAREDVDVNSRSESGLTPVAWAVVNGDPEVLRVFLQSGKANLDYNGSGAGTLMEYARRSGTKLLWTLSKMLWIFEATTLFSPR